MNHDNESKSVIGETGAERLTYEKPQLESHALRMVTMAGITGTGDSGDVNSRLQ